MAKLVWRLSLLLWLVTPGFGQGPDLETLFNTVLLKNEPSCDLNLTKLLPAAEYWGPVSCSLQDPPPTGMKKCESLKGKVALITGASTGIGYGTALRLTQAGMKVIGTSRNPTKYRSNCTFNIPGDKCRPQGWQLWRMDQSTDSSVAAVIDKVKQKYGQIDFLFLNAGINIGAPTFHPVDTPKQQNVMCNDIEPMSKAMNINFFGPLRVLKAVLPLMPKSGYARVLATSSIASLAALEGGLVYAASKASIDVMAQEWLNNHYDKDKKTHIKLITIHPGNTRTNIWRNSIPACDAADLPVTATEWEKYGALEACNYNNTYLPFTTALEAGESVYRIALEPEPSKRYILNRKETLNYMRRRVCTHLTHPPEEWPSDWTPVGIPSFCSAWPGIPGPP